MKIFLGFDPGGEMSFGWAVCKARESILEVKSTGTASNAEDAIDKTVLKYTNDTIIGVGIDAPLFWSRKSNRDVDENLQRAISIKGCKKPKNTVLKINSLRGACLFQGILIAYLLRERIPEILITESHPTAMLYLMGLANSQLKPKDISMKKLSVKRL